MMGWIEEQAAQIGATVKGSQYLAVEFGVELVPDGPDSWVASRCPLCGAERSFRLRETEQRLCDWRCRSCPPDGAEPVRGDLIDLVMRLEHLEKTDAVHRVLERGRAHLAPVPSDLELLRHSAQYFRFTRDRQATTLEYLAERSITDPADLDPVFHLGGNEVAVEGLLNYLRSAVQRPVSIATLNRLKLVQGQRIQFCPAVSAPLYESDGRFIGLHLRRCGEHEPRFINRGLSQDDRNRLIYGLHSADVKQAIKDQQRVVVGKGVVDAWAGYQAGRRNTVATLSPRMTRAQLKQLTDLEVHDIVLGFTSETESKIVAAMAEEQDEALHPLIHQLPGEAALHALLHGESIEAIVAGAEAAVAADQRARGLARARQARELTEHELREGRYFLLPVEAVVQAVKHGRRAAGELVALLERHRARDARSGQSRYLKVPWTFIDTGLHRRLGPTLRVLMYLHSKTTTAWRPVTILNHTICEELEAALSGIQAQKKKLSEEGLLVQLPAADQRHAWQYYPSFVPSEEDR